MKVILCICLVVPLVLGDIIDIISSLETESGVDIQGYDYLDDFLNDPNEEQRECAKDVVKSVKEENPDLEWWFNDLEKLAKSIKPQYEKCKSIDKEPEQKKCLLKLKHFTKRQLLKIVKSLPKDKKPVLIELIEGIKKCFE